MNTCMKRMDKKRLQPELLGDPVIMMAEYRHVLFTALKSDDGITVEGNGNSFIWPDQVLGLRHHLESFQAVKDEYAAYIPAITRWIKT